MSKSKLAKLKRMALIRKGRRHGENSGRLVTLACLQVLMQLSSDDVANSEL